MTAQPLPRAFRSRLLRLSRTVLILGGLAAVALAFGDVLLARIGVGVAVVTAVLAAWSAWREYAELRTRTQEESTAEMAAHGLQLREERTRHLAVMDTLAQRNEGLRGELGASVARGERLAAEVSSLRDDNDDLRGRNRDLVAQNESLTTDLAEVRTEHQALTARFTDLEQRNGELEFHLAELDVRDAAGVVEFEERRPA